MNKHPDISILVPVYNNARWLRGCFDSICNQSHSNIEILLSDDGTTEQEAIDIIDEYVAHDDRIILDRHPNIGCGKSLNRLLNKASGIYIATIDCDDKYADGALQTLMELSRDGHHDFVKCSYDADTGTEVIPVKLWDDSLIGTTIDTKLMYSHDRMKFLGTTPSLWCGMYNRNWMQCNDIRWQPTPGALYQDTSMSFVLKAAAQSAVVTNDIVYHYNLTNEDSQTRKTGNYIALANEYDATERWLKEHGVHWVWPEFARIRFAGMMWMLGRIPEEDQRTCLMQILKDMNDEVINSDWYTAEELEFIRGTRIC